MIEVWLPLSYLFVWSISQCFVTIFHVAITPSPVWKLWQFSQATFLEGDLLTPLSLTSWVKSLSHVSAFLTQLRLQHPVQCQPFVGISSLSHLVSDTLYRPIFLCGHPPHPAGAQTPHNRLPSLQRDTFLIPVRLYYLPWTFTALLFSTLPLTQGHLPNSALANGFKIEMFKKGRKRKSCSS